MGRQLPLYTYKYKYIQSNTRQYTSENFRILLKQQQ